MYHFPIFLPREAVVRSSTSTMVYGNFDGRCLTECVASPEHERVCLCHAHDRMATLCLQSTSARKRPENPKKWIDFGPFQRVSARFEGVSACFKLIQSSGCGNPCASMPAAILNRRSIVEMSFEKWETGAPWQRAAFGVRTERGRRFRAGRLGSILESVTVRGTGRLPWCAIGNGDGESDGKPRDRTGSG